MTKTSHNPLFNWLFRGPDGQIILLQTPNLPLIIWLGGTALSILTAAVHIFPPAVHATLHLTAAVGLLYWSVLEISGGSNNFRRILGLVTFALLIISKNIKL